MNLFTRSDSSWGRPLWCVKDYRWQGWCKCASTESWIEWLWRCYREALCNPIPKDHHYDKQCQRLPDSLPESWRAKKLVRHRYLTISLVSELSFKVSPDWSNGSIFLIHSLKLVAQVGSRLHARYKFTHIHGHLFVLRTATMTVCRNYHWYTTPPMMCITF